MQITVLDLGLSSSAYLVCACSIGHIVLLLAYYWWCNASKNTSFSASAVTFVYTKSLSDSVDEIAPGIADIFNALFMSWLHVVMVLISNYLNCLIFLGMVTR